MKIYTLKATKSRSNPQVIREFQIDGRRPVTDLFAMLDLLFGSNISQYAVFTQGEQTLADLSVPIEGIFTKQSHFLCVVDDPISPSVLFLDVLDITEEEAFSCPHLLRYRVSNKKERGYYSSYLDSMEETYQNQLDELNRSIRRHFLPDTTAPDFCWNIGTSLQEILEESTAAAIRQMILPLNLPVKSTLPKQAQIKAVVEWLNTDAFWTMVLDSMSLTEYQNFKTLCTNGGIPDQKRFQSRLFPVLDRYLLIRATYWGNLQLPKELMTFYEQWLEQGKEKDYLAGKTLSIVILGAAAFYGFVNRPVADTLFKHCFPDQWRPELTQTFFANPLPEELSGDLSPLSKGLYYHSAIIDQKDGSALYQLYVKRQRHLYLPTKEELLDMVTNGPHFSQKTTMRIFDLMNQRLRQSSYNCHFLISQVALGAYIGSDIKQLMTYLQDNLHLRKNDATLGQIGSLIIPELNTIRKLPLGGYTEIEFRKIFH